MNSQEQINAKFNHFREAVDDVASYSFQRVSRRNWKYIFEDQPIGSSRYEANTQEKFQSSRLLQNEPIDIKFYTDDKYQWIAKIQFGYMARMLNQYMYDTMQLSEDEIKDYFKNMSEFDLFLEYEDNFKQLFTDMALKLLGGHNISRDFLHNRSMKAKIAVERKQLIEIGLKESCSWQGQRR